MRFMLAVLLLFQFITFAQEAKVKFTNVNLKNVKIASQEIGKQLLKVTVTGEDGEAIPNLGVNDFEIWEKDTKAKIVKVNPLSESVESQMRVVMCLDNSTSMSPHVEEVLNILDQLVSLFPKKANVDVILFDDSGRKNLFKYGDKKLQIYGKNFNGNNKELQKYFRSEYNNLTTRTYLYDQMITAFQIVNSEKTRDNELFIILLSDGQDVGSSFGKEEAKNLYKKGKLFFVDFQRLGNEFLQSFAEEKNALYFQAENIEELGKYFKVIGDKIIFSGYEITYQSRLQSQIFFDSFNSLVNNQRIPIDKLKIEEVKSREIFPLLNYIFFQKNSSLLDDKYNKLDKEEKEIFQISSIVPSQMNVYYNLLNIIGYRLTNFPDTKITITGCNDETDSEKGNISLSKERAEVVRRYLSDVWNIGNERMEIAWRNSPSNPSNKKDTLGIEENRRVEITSTDPRILEVVESFSNSLVSEPEILFINSRSETNNEIQNWTFTVQQQNKKLYEQKGTFNFPSSIAWNVTSALAGKEITSGDFEFSVRAVDKVGVESVPNSFKLPINLITQEKKKLEALGDKFVEKVSLVLFEFNSSNLDTRNKNAIMNLNESIKLNSTLIVKGYTDAIGSEEANLRLSQNRAKNVLESIKKLLKPETKLLSFVGIGKTAPLYDNNLPEGRFHNRTCQIVIETPLTE